MNEYTAHGPGRVELLGNHTDYNGGFVMSAAIDRGVTITGRPTENGQIILRSGVMEDSVEIYLDGIVRQDAIAWANYPLGVVNVFKQAGHDLGGFEATIASDLPLGAGLSSSAALEVATAVFLCKLFGISLEPMEMAKVCRKAENEFVGVNCGLLDQVSSVFGKKSHAIFLDCREETVRNVPLPEGIDILITHSGVKHSLVGGEYNERRAQCFEAASRLGVKELRDATRAQVEGAKDRLPDLVYRRAAHVTGENERVLAGIEHLEAGRITEFGALMFDSHESSRVNFENSTPELDALVEIARGLPGVLGSRLTGGGFGGATVSLVHHEQTANVCKSITEEYAARTGNVCHTYVCEAADGAH